MANKKSKSLSRLNLEKAVANCLETLKSVLKSETPKDVFLSNPYFLNGLKKIDEAERRRLAEEMVNQDELWKNDNDVLSFIIFTDTGEECLINPEIMRFGLEELEEANYEKCEMDAWLDRVPVFIGEVVLDRLKKGQTIAEGDSLEEYLKDYYLEHGLGPVPEELPAHAEKILEQLSSQGLSSPISQSELLFFSLMTNLLAKLEFLSSEMVDNKRFFYFLEELIRLYRRSGLNPALISDNPDDYIARKMAKRMFKLYLFALLNSISNSDDERIDSILSALLDEIRRFSGSKSAFEEIADTLTNAFVLFFVDLTPKLDEKVNKDRIITLFSGLTDIFAELIAGLDHEDERVNELFRLFSELLLFMAYQRNYNLKNEEEIEQLLRNDSERKAFKKSMLNLKKAILYVNADELSELTQNVEENLKKVLQVQKERAKQLWREDDTPFKEITECARILTNYCDDFRKEQDKSFELWRDTENFLETFLENGDEAPLKLKAALLYAKLRQALVKLNGSEKDPEAALELLEKSREEAQAMLDLIDSGTSQMAHELMHLYYYIVGLYQMEVKDEAETLRALRTMEKVKDDAAEAGFVVFGDPRKMLWDL